MQDPLSESSVWFLLSLVAFVLLLGAGGLILDQLGFPRLWIGIFCALMVAGAVGLVLVDSRRRRR